MIKFKIALGLICLILVTSCVNFKEIKCDGISGFRINKINLQGIEAIVSLKIKTLIGWVVTFMAANLMLNMKE